ncbi:hypothetical protein E2C01_076669 [Portunus trituberculatus]|uniref:Uncharacterized protein n=1 Tax=Portunus trituberculatus TaxID=210409 RepID=A0A5B7IJC2_PORTR|nr:hypothetical protein [Portunus trituberculatus]
MLRKHTISVRNGNMSKIGYFGLFQRFMQQNSELQPKHTISIRK